LAGLSDWIVGVIAFLIPSMGSAPPQVYNGYLEADYVYLAPLGSGRIATISVAEGDQVTAGTSLVTLENTSQMAALRAAHAGVAVAEANLENLQTGSRETEITVIRASLQKAEADLALARATFERSERLLAQGDIPAARADQDRAAYASAEAQVAQLRAELEVAQLPARAAQRTAAEATLEQARAEAQIAQIALDDRNLATPVDGRVERVFFDAGEVVGAGAPILSILQPEKIKAIFFVPEADRANLTIGKTLALACDGCPPGVTAQISRLASDPQYTPPILYSRDERERLVFRAEAILDAGHGLLPGQPITLQKIP
jgi:HlyD family secretion protein